ncbi:MAG: TIGR00730 family Rossman fold protein [Planctomycetota bacterium]
MSDSRFHAVKAYKNPAFLNSRHARELRILSEYLEPEARFEELKIRDTIVMFGSARTKSREDAEKAFAAAKQGTGNLASAKRDLMMSRYYEDTRSLAHKLTEWSKSLEDPERRFVICSGGGPGIMEAANRGASEARGENIGLNISLPFEQSGNPYITRQLEFEFHYFFMRKFWFSYLAKAFVVFPGGFGTMDEFFEVLTLIQTEKIKKNPAIVLFGTEFWDKVVNLEALVEFGTISPGDLSLFHKSDSVDDAYEHIVAHLEAKFLQDKAPVWASQPKASENVDASPQS